MSKPDVNLLGFGNLRPLGIRHIGDLDGGGSDPVTGIRYSDALKVTDCTNGTVVVGHLIGGKEDCVDVNNHCDNIKIVASLFEPRGKYVATIKGGSKNITVQGCIRGHGSEVDIDIGNVSDQSDNLTGPVKLLVWTEDGSPVTVRCLGGPRPILMNSEYQRYKMVLKIPGFWQSWFLKGYKFLKKLGLPI